MLDLFLTNQSFRDPKEAVQKQVVSTQLEYSNEMSTYFSL